VSGPEAHLERMVDIARRKLANSEERRDLDAERDAVNWELVNEAGLLPRVAAAAIRERLEREGFTADQIAVLGAISEASIRNVARLRRKP
jgi:hypothetical protein